MCDLVRLGEEILGTSHNPERAARWREWWDQLTEEQRGLYNRAQGRNREGVREPSQERKQKAGELVDQADRLVSEILSPGRWPQAKTVDRFLDEGRLERLLSLYSQAMWLDPSEPAYPWNLSSVLRRLGQNDLAIAFLTRAISTGEKLGDGDFFGPDAYLALAEMAIDAGEPDLALVAIARAHDLGHGREDIDSYVRRLVEDINLGGGQDAPGRSLMRLLEHVTG